MTTIILVHGAWHYGAAWDKVKKLLEKGGHTVIAPDLPGLGKNFISTTDSANITMEDYISFVVNLVENSFKENNEKVILVGHSLAGITISQVAERIPDKIEKLIHLCSFYLQNNESLIDIAATYENKLQFRYYENNKVYDVVPELVELLYNDCSKEDIDHAKNNIRPQPTEPANYKAKISDISKSVTQIYIECTKDQGIPIKIQRKMVAKQPCTVYTLETDHSPFFSTPGALAEIIAKEVELSKFKAASNKFKDLVTSNQSSDPIGKTKTT